MPHVGDDPGRLVDLPFVAADDDGPLRHQVRAAICQRDIERENPPLNSQPLGPRGCQCVGLIGEGVLQRFGPAADARHHAAARASLGAVVESLDPAVGIAVAARVSVAVAVATHDARWRQGCATRGTGGPGLAE